MNPRGLFHYHSHTTTESRIALPHALGKQDIDMIWPEAKGITQEGNCTEPQLQYQCKLYAKVGVSIIKVGLNIWTWLWITNILITSSWSATDSCHLSPLTKSLRTSFGPWMVLTKSITKNLQKKVAHIQHQPAAARWSAGQTTPSYHALTYLTWHWDCVFAFPGWRYNSDLNEMRSAKSGSNRKDGGKKQKERKDGLSTSSSSLQPWTIAYTALIRHSQTYSVLRLLVLRGNLQAKHASNLIF